MTAPPGVTVTDDVVERAVLLLQVGYPLTQIENVEFVGEGTIELAFVTVARHRRAAADHIMDVVRTHTSASPEFARWAVVHAGP